MMDISQANEWQFIDERVNLIYPWYTKSFLDVLKTWDLSDKVVFEYGVGYSTIWFAKNCKKVMSIDSSLRWVKDVDEYSNSLGLQDKMSIHYVDYPEKDETKWWEATKFYADTSFLKDMLLDIIVIDGSERDGCITPAIENIKPGGIIICDNWMQEGVWICQCPELLTKYEHYIYKQEGHPHWQTAYFIINKA